MFNNNILLATDSYKFSHWKQYPPKTEAVMSYIECRGGDYEEAVFFGLQMFLKRLEKGFTQDDIEEAAAFTAAHGTPFNREGWEAMLKKHGGKFPVIIRAVPEGSVVPIQNLLAAIENTDDEFYWLTSYLETALLRAIWYPTTVATISWRVKNVIREFMEMTAEDCSGIDFMLHDFGARGVSSSESAAIGGAAHLVNFMGSDTVEGVLAANKFYNEPMSAFSIPAAEHSTMTTWGGREGEVDAMRNMIEQFGGKDKLFAVVSDSYDIYHACETLWGEKLKMDLIRKGGRLIVRPDSGHPPEVVLKVCEILGQKFGFSVNSKGFKVLHPSVRVIQGDGIDEGMVRQILAFLRLNNWSAENMAFGMGGALLQHCDRDTMQWAMKACAAKVDGKWIDVFKDPITSTGKKSKKGRITLYRDDEGRFYTGREAHGSQNCALETVFHNGVITKEWTLSEIRARVAETSQ